MKKLHAAHHPGPKAFMDAINTRTTCIFAASCLHPVGYVSSPGQTRQLIWTCREKMLRWPRVIVNAVRWNLKSKGVKFNPRFQATVVVMGTMLDDITCGRIPIEEGRWKYHLTDGIGAEKTCGALLMQNCCSSSCRSNLSNPCGPGSTNWPNWSQRVCLDLIANLNNAYFFSKKYGHGQSSF